MYTRFLPALRIRGRAVQGTSSVLLVAATPCRRFSGKGSSGTGSNDRGTDDGESDAAARDTRGTAPSPWDPRRNSKENASLAKETRDAAQARLTSLFQQDVTRRELRMGGAPSSSRNEGKSYDQPTTARLVLDQDGDRDDVEERGGDDGTRRDGPSSSFAHAAPQSSRFFSPEVDEDEVGAAGTATHPIAPQRQVSRARTEHNGLSGAHPKARLEMLEQELLDDDFLFFPPATLAEETKTAGALAASHDSAEMRRRRLHEKKDRYVPGQQIVPPGLTRYRVDVQYQGSDFDGWYKSSVRQWEVVERLPDGTARRRRPARPEETGSTAGAGHATGVAAEGMQTRHHARTILEDALAVALDVPAVSVVAAAIPETGVSVRRLTCHVDLPSELEMQPRTIIQRATMWLQAHHQPLAILTCHPCKNQDFHARHSGVRRVYCYRILNRVAPPLFDAGLQWHVDRHLDVARMQRFAAAMEGTKDYGYFADPKMANALRRAAASGSGNIQSSPAFADEHEALTVTGRAPWERTPAPKADVERGLSHLQRAAALPTFNEYGQKVLSYEAKPKEYFKARTNLPTVRTIDKIDVVRQEDEVLIWFVGQSFLRHQIRNMVSVLKASGNGLWDEQELQHAFQSGFEVSRKKFQRERLPPAPAYGLTLWDVEYPQQHRDDFVSFVDSGPYEEVDISAIN